MKFWKMTASSAAILAASLATAPAMAQQNQQAPAQLEAPAAASDFSDAQLESFVSASKKVASISNEYTPKLQATTDEDKRQQVYQEADEKMVHAVQKEGMSVDEFNNINQALQSDPQLMRRIQNLTQ